MNILSVMKTLLNERTETISAYYSVCPRLASYEYNLDLRTLIGERTNAMPHLNFGGYVHAKTLTKLEEMGCEVERKIPLDEHGCPGRFFKADAVCGDVVVELKTASTNRSRPYWEWQLKVYMSLLGLRRGKLVVFWSPTANMSEYDFLIDEVEAEKVKKRVRRMCSAITEDWRNVEPVRGRWCDLCPIKRQCMNEKLTRTWSGRVTLKRGINL